MKKGILKTIFVTGCRNDKWPSLRYIEKEISLVSKAAHEAGNDIDYVVTGTSRPIDAKIVSACKLLKIKILQVPANFMMLSGASAEQMRNSDVLANFAPASIMVFLDKEIAESDSVLEHLVSIAYKAHIPVTLVKKSVNGKR